MTPAPAAPPDAPAPAAVPSHEREQKDDRPRWDHQPARLILEREERRRREEKTTSELLVVLLLIAGLTLSATLIAVGRGEHGFGAGVMSLFLVDVLVTPVLMLMPVGSRRTLRQ